MSTLSSPWVGSPDRSVTARGEEDWRTGAACRDRDLDLFFPLNERRGVECAAGKLICRSCPVADKCLEWATRTGAEFGIFGGWTGPERRTIQRRRPR